MALQCDYPCQLDLWVKVIKAKNIQKDEQIVFDLDAEGNKIPRQLCIVPSGDCSPTDLIACVEDIKIRDFVYDQEFICNSKVRVIIDFLMVMIIRTQSGCYFIHTEPVHYEKTIPFTEFTPPFTQEEFEQDIDQSIVLIRNVRWIADVDGPCLDPYGQPTEGTIIYLSVFADIIDKLGKMKDVIVYGELDPLDP